MSSKDLSFTLTVSKTPEAAFEAINNVRGWWSETVEGGTQQLNDEFVYRHKQFHYSKQRLTEVIPGKRVVWLVTDSSLNFIDDKTEWTGTTISFDIMTLAGQTQIKFTHHGLTPGKECYDACSNGWNQYLGSLENLINTGKGKPDTKDI